MKGLRSDMESGGHHDGGCSFEESRVIENFKLQLNKMVAKVDELEQRVSKVAQFYSSLSKKQPSNSKGGLIVKDRDEDKQVANKKPLDPARKEPPSSKRKLELMRQISTILRQIMQHKWAGPFMQPVDVDGLGLDDYYEIIDTPMDFTTIRNKMEAKDGTGYTDVRQICADVRLIFKNAMTYNDEKSDIYVMAKTLLEKFEEKWLVLLPKVMDEEAKGKSEEAEALADMQLAREADNAKIARDISNELYELDSYLDEVREMVVQKCRKMTTEEKRKIGIGLSRLSPEDLNKALEIIAQKNPSFQPTAEEVDLDMDAQSESTLWRLNFFVKNALEVQAKSATLRGHDNSKRKREICDALAKTAKKRGKKLPA